MKRTRNKGSTQPPCLPTTAPEYPFPLRKGLVSVFLKTNEDNLQPFRMGNLRLLHLSMHGNISPPGGIAIFRTSVWGRDDFYLEYDTHNEQEAIDIFDKTTRLEWATCAALAELGYLDGYSLCPRLIPPYGCAPVPVAEAVNPTSGAVS